MSIRPPLRAIRTPALVAALLGALAGGASAQWKLTHKHLTKFQDTDLNYTCGQKTKAKKQNYAEVEVSSNGQFTTGSGYAEEWAALCDVSAQTGGTGIISKDYTWVGPPGHGFAKVKAWVSANGAVTLDKAESAAAALGWGEFSSNITPTITAILTKSAAETKTNVLGKVDAAFKGFGGSILVKVSTGLGTFKDNDSDFTSAQKCTDFFTRKHRGRGFMKVWADGGAFTGIARCHGSMSANVHSLLWLWKYPNCAGPVGGGPGDLGMGPVHELTESGLCSLCSTSECVYVLYDDELASSTCSPDCVGSSACCLGEIPDDDGDPGGDSGGPGPDDYL